MSADHDRVLAMIEADLARLRAENERLRELLEHAVDFMRRHGDGGHEHLKLAQDVDDALAETPPAVDETLAPEEGR